MQVTMYVTCPSGSTCSNGYDWGATSNITSNNLFTTVGLVREKEVPVFDDGTKQLLGFGLFFFFALCCILTAIVSWHRTRRAEIEADLETARHEANLDLETARQRVSSGQEYAEEVARHERQIKAIRAALDSE